MTRSVKKGPYINEKILKKVTGKKPEEAGVILVWDRACQIAPEMVGFTFGIHNGKKHIEVKIVEDMVGHRLGEFAPELEGKPLYQLHRWNAGTAHFETTLAGVG